MSDFDYFNILIVEKNIKVRTNYIKTHHSIKLDILYKKNMFKNYFSLLLFIYNRYYNLSFGKIKI